MHCVIEDDFLTAAKSMQFNPLLLVLSRCEFDLEYREWSRARLIILERDLV